MFRTWLPILMCASLTLAGCGSKTSSPTQPTTPAPTVSSVTVSGSSALTSKGQTAQLTATVTMSDGTSQVVTGTATWQSSNTAIATVSTAGLATAVGDGEATMTATYQTKNGTLKITVTLPKKAVIDMTEALTIFLSTDPRGKYRSECLFTFKETGGVFGYTFTAFQIIYRDQSGAAIGNPQSWDATNIASALGNGGRIEAGGTKSNWGVNLFWNPPITRLTTDWQATVRDDTGLISTPQGSQTANMPAGIVVSLTGFPFVLPLRFAQ